MNASPEENTKVKIRRIVLWGLPVLFLVLSIAYYLSTLGVWKTYTNLSDNWLSDMEIKMAGQVWDGPIGGVKVFDGESWVPAKSGTAKFSDSKGKVWSISDSKFTISSWRRTFYGRAYSVNIKINAFALDPLGRAWLATNNGVLVKARDEGWIEYTQYDSGLHNNKVKEILIDPSGNIWFYSGSEILSNRSGKTASRLVLYGEYLPGYFNKNILFFTFFLFSYAWLAMLLHTPKSVEPKRGELANKYVVMIGLIFGFIGGFIPAFHGGLPYILYDVFNITFGIIIHIAGAILFNGIAGAALGILGAKLGIKRIQSKEMSALRQISVAIIWGLAFGLIPNIFVAGVAW
jgi:hypothetical protein